MTRFHGKGLPDVYKMHVFFVLYVSRRYAYSILPAPCCPEVQRLHWVRRWDVETRIEDGYSGPSGAVLFEEAEAESGPEETA